MTTALFYAAIGGVMWGFGPFGKRYGVHTATLENRVSLSAVVYLVYAVGTFVFPFTHFVAMMMDHRRAAFLDEEWQGRVPAIFATGLCSGCAGPCATYALALAGRNASCLISMVTSGIYSVVGAMLIMQVFDEKPGFLQYLSAVLILAGIFMMEAGKPVEKEEDSKLIEETRPVPVPEGGDSAGGGVYGATREWCARASQGGYNDHLLATFFAVMAGLLWALGQLGKRYGAHGAPEGMRSARSACTFFVYNVATFVPVVFYFAYKASAGLLAFPEQAWYRRGLVVFVCGIICGLGGVLATYAFALASKNESALLAMIENGVYTAVGGLLIGLVYQERLTRMQIGAGGLMVLAVVCASASPHR
jgi:drug/metabolite transporter (DMT)-like permease